MSEKFDLLTPARQALQEMEPPPPEVEPVLRRARSIRARRTVAAAMTAAVVAAGVLVPLGALGLLHGNTAPHPSPTRPASPGAAPVLDFQAAPGWNVVATDPSIADQPGAPQAWAANVPFDPRDVPPASTQGYPGGYPEHTVLSLPPDGIVIEAYFLLETRNPLPPSQQFPERTLPLHLERAPISGWEGQPREDLSLSGVSATVDGWWVTVTAVFGTKDPSQTLIDEADQEIGRLVLPPAPETTDAFDEFGIRMDHPDGWYGTLTAWSASQPILEAATVPISDLYDGSSARKALGPDDLFLVLAENDAYAARYEPISLPVSIRPEDACPTCEINDDGTSPPPDHSLFYRSFSVSDREFDLWVEFGTPTVSADQLARVNDVLATLQVDPPATPPPPEPASSPAPVAPVSADVPAGWTEKDDPVPSAVDPRVVAAWGTWDFPTGGDCGPEPALQALPADGAFVWVFEYGGPGNRGDFATGPGGPPTTIDLQTPPARWRCAASAPSRAYLFTEAGRYFELHVAFGPNVSAAAIAGAEHLMATFSADLAG